MRTPPTQLLPQTIEETKHVPPLIIVPLNVPVIVPPLSDNLVISLGCTWS